MWLHGGQADETPIATAAEGVGYALSSAVGGVMMFTAGCMLYLMVASDSFTAGSRQAPATLQTDAVVQQWCVDARHRLELAEAMRSAETAKARADANLLCAKAVSPA